MKKKIKSKVNYSWITKIVLISFAISIFLSFIAETLLPNVNIIIGILIMILFVFLGILFDMIGVAVTVADEQVFHSMAAKKIKGASLAIKFKKNADKVSSFCQDVIGDICGIVTGSMGTVISLKIMSLFNYNGLLITLIIMGMISAMTIGGKALEKSIAINKSNDILYRFAYIISCFVKK